MRNPVLGQEADRAVEGALDRLAGVPAGQFAGVGLVQDRERQRVLEHGLHGRTTVQVQVAVERRTRQRAGSEDSPAGITRDRRDGGLQGSLGERGGRDESEKQGKATQGLMLTGTDPRRAPRAGGMQGDATILTAWLGLGANLPRFAGTERMEPEQTLVLAIASIGELGTVAAVSGLWRTTPVGPVTDQPLFTNAALRLETGLAPRALLQALQEIERRFGRTRGLADKGPRVLDLDILLLADEGGPLLWEEPGLVVPHPEMHRRRFVLAPLTEIAPDAEHPVFQRTIAALLRALPEGEQVRRL